MPDLKGRRQLTVGNQKERWLAASIGNGSHQAVSKEKIRPAPEKTLTTTGHLELLSELAEFAV